MIQAARLVFGFGGIFDADEAERILESQSDSLSAGEELTAVVTSNEASPDARRMATKLIYGAKASESHGVTLVSLPDEGLAVDYAESCASWTTPNRSTSCCASAGACHKVNTLLFILNSL